MSPGPEHERPTKPRLDDTEALRAALRRAAGVLRDVETLYSNAALALEDIQDLLDGGAG